MRLFHVLCVATCLSIFPAVSPSQSHEAPPKATVMTLGVFHFSFPNLDARKIEAKDQIDVLVGRLR